MSKQNNTLVRPVPVDREVMWDKTQIILSKTDQYGTIEYANETFIDVSGYEDYELMSQPHNIIRHPEMPQVIFKILWDNLKQGKNFHAIVKNLAKTGRYYWVITDFDITKNNEGTITNYVARRRAVPQEIITKHIEPLYKRLLQIENVSGLNASEKYLIGFLEEKQKSYVEYMKDIVLEYEKEQSSLVEKEEETDDEEKGLFRKFLSLF